MKTKILLFLLYINLSFSQAFIPIDNDTHEFIEDVNYSLFLKKKNIFNGVTKNNEITKINPSIEYDSITFSRIDYHTLGLQKKQIDSIIYLSKKTFYLDEVVISSKKDNSIILGETNRFIKKQSRPILKELDYGIIFKNDLNEKISIDKIVFFTEKIFHKTAYKINFYEITETLPKYGNQSIEIGNLVYSTDTLYVNKKGVSKNEILVDAELFLGPTETLFVSIELLNYYDESNNIINPSNENKTKLKFQISNRNNYYSKRMNLFTKKMTDNHLNINLSINYDFANQFFKKPHKSILVTPAILLYAKKTKK